MPTSWLPKTPSTLTTIPLQHSTEYYIATAAVAFWHACQAKQCLNYARQDYEAGQIPTIAADLLRQADQLITKALERTDGDLPDALDIDPVPKALVSARARLNTVQDLTETLQVLHPLEDPHPQRALIRMIAYMGPSTSRSTRPSSTTPIAKKQSSAFTKLPTPSC